MKNKLENEMFGEFDYMYRHKKKAPPITPEVQPPAPTTVDESTDENKQSVEAKNTAAKKASVNKNIHKKAAPVKQTTKNVSKKNEPVKAAPVKKATTLHTAEGGASPKQKESGKIKIHPAYGKPYRSDRVNKQKDTGKNKAVYRHERTEEENRRYNERRRRFREQLKISLMKSFAISIISVILACVLFAVSIAALQYVVGYTQKAEHKRVNYQIGSEDDLTSVTYASVIRNGVPYVSGQDIVSLCGFTVTGTKEEVKYISPDKGNESASFVVGSTQAYVNRVQIRLCAPTVSDEGKLYIPLEFFADYALGVVCEYIPETKDERASITVYKRILNEVAYKTQGAAPLYEDVAFRIKATETVANLSEESIKDNIKAETYKTDVSAYDSFINPEEIFGYLQTISSTKPASADFVYDDLQAVIAQTVTIKEPIMLRKYAAMALEAMIAEARAENLTRYAVFKGYTTLETSNLDNPSADEHLLGLSIDLYFTPKDVSYAESNIYAWFSANAHKFGYTVRYPLDKTEQTGVEFRPWTLRYVGRYAATKMYEQNLCLEEFIVKYRLEGFITQ